MQGLNEARSKVNGKFLCNYNGKPVTIVGKIIKVHSNGTLFEMKSTDNHVITVLLNNPLSENVDGWVEIRGSGQGKCNVICHHLFPMNDIAESFGLESKEDLASREPLLNKGE